MPVQLHFTTLRAAALSAVSLALLCACDGAGMPGIPGGSGANASDLSIDGSGGAWTTAPGDKDAPGDAQFNRQGVATGVQLRAHEGERTVELFGTFLGEPAEPVFVTRHVQYEDGQGTVFKRRPVLASGDEHVEEIRWQHLEIDHEAGVGRATVALDVRVCADQYSGPTDSETVCHLIEGSFDTALVHNPRLRVMR